jgi:vancomycin permeability regulator SanA
MIFNMSLIMKLVLMVICIILISLILIRIYVILYAIPRTVSIESSPKSYIAVVFGAGLLRDGTPSPVLRDRVTTAVDLYKLGKIEKILMSGDNRLDNYNEPVSMTEYAHKLGVPTKDIVLDFEGQSTFETCSRLRILFGQDQVLLVTQSFHLPRSIFICNQLGLKAFGVSADRRKYWVSSQIYWQLRELPASAAALWEVWINRSESILVKSE